MDPAPKRITDWWTAVKPVSPYQFALFRIGFGVYLVVHFAMLLPYGAELFSNRGVLADPTLNPLFGLFPNPLVWWGTPGFVCVYLSVAIGLSLMFTLGAGRRFSAVGLWFIWASLYNRNNLIINPGIPYVGLMLILCALLPRGDRLSIGSWRHKNNDAPLSSWYFPAMIYWVAWGLLALGYTFSGVVKLSSPSWINGETIRLLLDNPLARTGLMRDLMLRLPDLALKSITWISLAAEVSFIFLSFNRRTRLIAWLLMIGIHLGIVMVIDFADLTLGMLMIHWFTLDPEWFDPPAHLRNKKNIVFFDGVCSMCNGVVKFLVREDNHHQLYYAPLQGKTFQDMGLSEVNGQTFKSIIFVADYGSPSQRVYSHSTAVARLLICMGGFWQVIGWALWLIPAPGRNWGYNFVARHRYRWFGQLEEVCAIPTPDERSRFITE